MNEFLVQIDDETYISKDQVAGIQAWISYATDMYSDDEYIGTKVYLKTNQVLCIKRKTPREVMELLK
jgi:hypothetical protein